MVGGGGEGMVGQKHGKERAKKNPPLRGIPFKSFYEYICLYVRPEVLCEPVQVGQEHDQTDKADS